VTTRSPAGDLAAASVEDQIDRPALHDRCAGVSRKLDGDVTDPARGACDQHPLASGEPPVHKQCLPGGQAAHRQSCRLDMAQPQGLRCKHIGWDDGVLGSHAVTIERRERINLVTAVDDNARKLVRRNRRQSIDRPLQLVTRNGRRTDAHQHLARIRRGRLDLLNLQAVIVQPDR
jgi:hypothetical protein